MHLSILCIFEWVNSDLLCFKLLIKSTWINIIFETAPLGGGWLSPGWEKYYPICDTVYSYVEKGCPHEKSTAAKSEEKRLFSQAIGYGEI